MLTIFTTAKPFRDHINIIQRNAIRSWRLLHPEIEILLFGDDEGAAETAQELGVRHEVDIRKAEHGTKYLNHLFERAQQIARYDVLCYVNCDIILTSRFRTGVERAATRHRPFLIIGHRWDTNITEPLEFARRDWEERLMSMVSEHGKRQAEFYNDYFVFTRWLYRDIPPLVIGRIGWDNWLVWKALSQGAMVVDLSPYFKAVHQNHDYSYHPNGAVGVWGDELSKRNIELAGGNAHLCSVAHATHKITPSGTIRRKLPWQVKEFMFQTFVHRTLPVRRRLGLRRNGWLGVLLRG